MCNNPCIIPTAVKNFLLILISKDFWRIWKIFLTSRSHKKNFDVRKPSETPGENDWPGYFTITIKSNDCSHPSNICKRPWYPIAVAFQINFVVFLLQENFYILKWRHYLLLKMLVRVDSSCCCCPMNERVWPSLLGGKLTIFKIPFKNVRISFAL